MYWIHEDVDYPQNSAIMRAGMDGSHMELLTLRPKAKAELDLVVDHASRFLFWVEPTDLIPKEQNSWEILRSNMDGGNVTKVIRLREKPTRIHIVGDRLFWTRTGDTFVTGCDKETGNNLKAHDWHHSSESADHLIIVSSKPLSDRPERHPCSFSQLCSHICVPTPAGYMRCLCPPGYRLMPDGWTCGLKLI